MQDVNLAVAQGEIYGLLGPNGAGKTTTLRMLATLLRPDRGTIAVDGVDAITEPVRARSRLAYVPAEAGLPERLTPIETVRPVSVASATTGSRRSAPNGVMVPRS